MTSVSPDKEKRTHRIRTAWNPHTANRYYKLERFIPKEDKHSCYVCFEDWAWLRRKCPSNVDHWIYVAEGDLTWAERTSEHYGIRLPETLPNSGGSKLAGDTDVI